MIRPINFHYCHVTNDEAMPLAIVRFTSYDDDGGISAVSQITYESNSDYFQSEVSTALAYGTDVSILTRSPLTDFEFLHHFVEA
jgi:hypothetical protein